MNQCVQNKQKTRLFAPISLLANFLGRRRQFLRNTRDVLVNGKTMLVKPRGFDYGWIAAAMINIKLNLNKIYKRNEQ